MVGQNSMLNIVTSTLSLGFYSPEWSTLDFACILLFVGAMGKSGQIGLHAWLPNAMNAPTPVSALLHAATMVTAGVFLLARISPLLEYAPLAGSIVTFMGAITTLFAGTIGLVQNDFKSIIAYSTCSQLGYMVTICGLSSYNVGIFHLFNHAFFKALLFLTAGAVIHALSNEQDIRKLGALQQIFRFSYCTLLIGTLALIGTPFLAGFYSKDVILELGYTSYSLAANFSYLLTMFSVFTTSYYSFRLLFMTFHSNKVKFAGLNKQTNLHKQTLAHAHDADYVMAFVLVLLALGSLYAGWLFKPMFIGLGTDFWNNSLFFKPNNSIMVEAEFLEQSVKLLPLLGSIAGGVLAYLVTMVCVKKSYVYASTHLRQIYLFLNQRWLYDKLLNSIAYAGYNLGLSFVKVFDKGLLELLPVSGLALAQSLKTLNLKLGATQSGLIYHYAIIIIVTSLCALSVLSLNNVLFSDTRIFVLMFAGLGLL